jgi:hypothetical protein
MNLYRLSVAFQASCARLSREKMVNILEFLYTLSMQKQRVVAKLAALQAAIQAIVVRR